METIRNDRFTIIFEELNGDAAAGGTQPLVRLVESMRADLEEIAELRRLVLEVTEPDPVSYTST